MSRFRYPLLAVALLSACAPDDGSHVICHAGHNDCGAPRTSEIHYPSGKVDTAVGFVSVDGISRYHRLRDSVRVMTKERITVIPGAR